ncbi:MAG: helix-turn-helix domain-containing protein [Caldilineaceae bacterium]
MGDKMHTPTDPYYFAWGKNRFYECYSAKPDLSLKCMFKGPGVYTTGDGGRFVVDDNAFLILNRQQPYSLIKQGATPVESFCVFYAAAWAQDILSSLTTPDLPLLDDPTPAASQPLSFFERLYPHNDFVTPYIQALRAYVVKVAASGIWVEEQLHGLLAGMIQTQWNVLKEAEQLPVARQSTRLELYLRLYRARDYIHAALAEPLSLADIAGAAHLSPHHFLRIFKQAFGLTPHAYLTQKRLEKAQFLLAHTQQPITEICFDVGFQSLGSFSTLFRREVGVSPRRYRQQARC